MQLAGRQLERYRKTILVVEDKQDFRATLTAILESNGYVIHEAANSCVAKEILRDKIVDVILSDIQMPGSGGIELLHWVGINKPTPFIFITGCSHILDAQAAFDLGAAGFVAKPFGINELLLEIKTVLSNGRISISGTQENYFGKWRIAS